MSHKKSYKTVFSVIEVETWAWTKAWRQSWSYKLFCDSCMFSYYVALHANWMLTACLCRQAAMKAVVATSRMHEGSRRRTDSCEIPASGTSRQSSMQDLPPESTSPTPNEKEATPPDQEVPEKAEPKLADQSALGPSPPRSPTTPVSEAPPTGSALVRPPLRADGLRQASVIPKSMLVHPRLPQKSCSVVEPGLRAEATPPLGSPPSPSTLSNGFAPGAEPSSKTAPCQWSSDSAALSLSQKNISQFSFHQRFSRLPGTKLYQKQKFDHFLVLQLRG